MIAIDNVVDVFSFNPSLELFNTLAMIQKEEILKRHTLSSIMLYTWKTSMLKIRAIDVIDQAVIDKADAVILDLLDELKEVKNFDKIIEYCLENTHSSLFYTIVKGYDRIEKTSYWAARKGYEDLTDIYRYDTVNILAQYGHNELAHRLIKMGYDNWDTVAYFAAKGGNIELVKDMIERGATDYKNIAKNAAMNGHLDIVKLFDYRLDYNHISYYAAQSGQLHIINYIKDRISNWTTVASIAYDNGHEDIVKLCVDYGVKGFKNTDYCVIRVNPDQPEWNNIALSAAKFGHTDIVIEAIKKNVSNLWEVAEIAAENGYIDIVKIIPDNCYSSNRTAIAASRNNHIDIVRLAVSKGVAEYRYIAEIVADCGDKELILDLFRESKNKLIEALKGEDIKEIEEQDEKLVLMNRLDFGVHIDCYKYFF